MALRDLSIETMVTVVGAWVAEKRDRSVIAKYPKLAPFLPDLDALHDTLLSAGQRVPTTAPEELAAVRAEIKALDERHDAVVRGVDLVMAGLAQLAVKPATRATLEALRDKLLPEGRRVVMWSLRRQGGAAERALSRLSPAEKKALRELKIPGGTLLGFFNERVTLARKLVDLDQRRLALLSEQVVEEPAGGTYDGVLAFVRTAGLFIAVADASRLDEDDRRRLFGSLEAALELAEGRRVVERSIDEALEALDASAEAQPADPTPS